MVARDGTGAPDEGAPATTEEHATPVRDDERTDGLDITRNETTERLELQGPLLTSGDCKHAVTNWVLQAREEGLNQTLARDIFRRNHQHEVNGMRVEAVDRIFKTVYNRRSGSGDDLSTGLMEWARQVGAHGTTAATETGPSEMPVEMQDRVAASLVRQAADREARRRLDEQDKAAARGPRVKRTARAYADVPRPAAILSDVLAAEVNLLGGPSEAGKSLLARDWVLSVASGESWRGHAVPEPRNVMVILSEGTHDFPERWARHSLWETAADRVFVLDEPVDLLSRHDVDWLLEEYAAERPGLVVFDVIYGMGMPDDNGTQDVLPVLAAMKRVSAGFDAATLAVGHPGHNGERRFRGSSSWRQLAATEWHLADGALTCEKSKIADKRRLSASYAVDYPWLRWLSPGEALAGEAQRRSAIETDIELHPDDTDIARARRLADGLGLSVERARKLVRAVKKEVERADLPGHDQP